MGVNIRAAALEGLPEIRVFFDDTLNLGHQGSMAHALTRLCTDLGYRGRVSAVYREGDERRGQTLDKLQLLFPDAPLTAHGTFCLNGCAISLTPFRERCTLPPVRAGLAVGADFLPRGNLAAELNVDVFLRLQPYAWQQAPDQIEYRNSAIPRKLPALYEHAFYVPRATARHPIRSRLVSGLFESISDSDVHVAVVYGVREPCVQGAHARDILALYIAGFLRAAAERPLRVMILNFDRSTAAEQDELLEVLAPDRMVPVTLCEHAAQCFEGGLLASGIRAATDRDGVAAGRDRATYMQRYQLREYTRIVGPQGAAADFDGGIAWLHGVASGVLLLNMGYVSPDDYAQAFARSSLPSLLEGQASASVAMSSGKPYLHAPNIGMILDYRYPKMTRFSLVTEQIEAVTDALVQGAMGTIPFESAASALGRFVQAARDEASSICSYYRSLSLLLKNPENDKLVLGLSTLAEALAQSGVVNKVHE